MECSAAAATAVHPLVAILLLACFVGDSQGYIKANPSPEIGKSTEGKGSVDENYGSINVGAFRLRHYVDGRAKKNKNGRPAAKGFQQN